MRPIFSILFGRWQQRCGLLPSVLQQFVILFVVGRGTLDTLYRVDNNLVDECGRQEEAGETDGGEDVDHCV